MANSNFDPAEFARTVERIANEEDKGEIRPRFDPQVHKDVREDALRGRKIGEYRQALENLGFHFIPAHRLNEVLGGWSDGSPHREGMWIHPDYDLQLAFTSDDILAHFSSPQNFWEWVHEQQVRTAAVRAGLIFN